MARVRARTQVRLRRVTEEVLDLGRRSTGLLCVGFFVARSGHEVDLGHDVAAEVCGIQDADAHVQIFRDASSVRDAHEVKLRLLPIELR